MKPDHPPRAAEALLQFAVSRSAYASAILGDMHERFARDAGSSRFRGVEYTLHAFAITASFLPSLFVGLCGDLAQDIAFAWRAFRRSPGFVVLVASMLAVGIGVNATAVNLIDQWYVRELPVPQPERIVALYAADSRHPARIDIGFESDDMLGELVRSVSGLDGIAVFEHTVVQMGGELQDESTPAAFVSGNYFAQLGISPQRGRLLQPSDDDPGTLQNGVVISDHLWRERFGARDDALGRIIRVGKTRLTIVGVTPIGFNGLRAEGRTALWIARSARAAVAGRAPGSAAGSVWLEAFGRMRAGVTLSQVQASASAAARDIRSRYPLTAAHFDVAVRLRNRLASAEISPNGVYMFAVAWLFVALLHLTACTNIAGLLMARAATRRRELGVRLCLGASRSRILSQALAESALIAAVGGVAGLLLALKLIDALSTMYFLEAIDTRLGVRIIVIVAVLTAATVLQFALLPALEAARTDPIAILRGDRGDGRRRRRDRSEMIVMVQVALSMLLLRALARPLTWVISVGD